MASVALECVDLSKKFRRGASFDSLRDLIPALIGRSLKRPDDPDLQKHEFWALKDLSFRVRQGEALGVIGHNGAGKSTLLKILSGIMRPTEGRLVVTGKLSALIEVGAGFHPDLTGRDNVYLNGVILGMSRREIRRKFDEIVQFAGLEDFIDTPVKRYSTGMYARLGFAVAAHVDPEVLLVDEVLSVGDWRFQSRCARKMTQLVDGGAAVVFVSHNLKAVAQLCSHAILLTNGTVSKLGSSEDVIRHYLESVSSDSDEITEKRVTISELTVLINGADEVRCTAGDRVVVRIKLRSANGCRNLVVHLYVVDGNFYEIFETSTDLLNFGQLSVDPGGERELLIELRMHVGSGLYYLGAVVRDQFDNFGQHDRKFPGATVYVDGPGSVRGPANLYPSLV